MAMIGDPTLLGWLVTVFYAIASWRSWYTGSCLHKVQQPFLFWGLLALLLMFLALNKQLDMQSWLYEWVKMFVRDNHLQGEKRTLKIFLLIGLAGLLLLGSATFIWLFFRQRYRPWGAMAGCLLLFTFVLLRAVVFTKSGVQENWLAGFWAVLEMTGIGLILFSTFSVHSGAKLPKQD